MQIIEDFKATIMEKPVVSVVMIVLGAVAGFFLAPTIRRVFKMKRK